MSIIMNVNLHAGNGIGPLSDFANFTSKPTISFVYLMIELVGLSYKLSLFFSKKTNVYGNLLHMINCKKKSFHILVFSGPANLHSLRVKMGVFQVTILLQSRE